MIPGKVGLKLYASIDRIDSTKGCVKGNIQFVSKQVDFLKASLSDAQVKHFFDTYYEMRKFREAQLAEYVECDAKAFFL